MATLHRRTLAAALALTLAAGFGVVGAAQAATTIPYDGSSIKVNGSCDLQQEYANAMHVAVFDASVPPQSKGDVYLQHDGTNLYVCLVGIPPGTDKDRFVSVYLDPLNAKRPLADTGDYSLQVDIVDSATSAYEGTGVVNGYVPKDLAGWTAVATAAVGQFDSAEYSIPLALAGGLCGAPFGLAVYRHWVTGTGIDYGWPGNQYFDVPQTWEEVTLGGASCNKGGTIAYVYREDTVTAGNFKALLETWGHTVDLIPLSAIAVTTDFSVYDLVIVAADTGSLNLWGTAAAEGVPISAGGKPILGLGEGGYAFFGTKGSAIGWPNGWHGPQDQVIAADTTLVYFNSPADFTAVPGLLPGPFAIYAAPGNEVGIYRRATSPADVVWIGWEPPPSPNAQPDHAPLVAQGCFGLWGFDDGPAMMNAYGKDLFLNAVQYALNRPCVPQQPPPDCVTTVTKTSVPAPPATVAPGDVVTYTISYTVLDDGRCVDRKAALTDKIPADTLFVPGSASGGVVPNFEGTLLWNFVLAPGASGSKTFQATVLDKSCNGAGTIDNTANLRSSLGTWDSNLVSLAVTCPPVVFPTTQPSYIEDEIEVYPYPLNAGLATRTTVHVRNISVAEQAVTLTFQVAAAPDRFGIGLPFADISAAGNPRVVTLPALSTIVIGVDWIPTFSGNASIRVKVEGAGFTTLYTVHSLDAGEDLHPGLTDDRTFAVGNPTAAAADITLLVENTCPGWSASVDPAVLVAVAPNDGDIRYPTLSVTPPGSGATLGTGCHIDVQAYIRTELVGGFRKLDRPPVDLPAANPPWEEKEITFRPDPPVAGVPGTICVELSNPTASPKTVTAHFAEADFGAGVGFTEFGQTDFLLPANSPPARYCRPWTPGVGGTLHRCLFVTLDQAGFRDVHSQRNVDVIRSLGPPTGSFPFVIRNPAGFPRTLLIKPTLVGLTGVKATISPDPPPFILAGETLPFTLVLGSTMAPDLRAAAPAGGGRFGDSSRVEVTVSIGGAAAGGFTVELAPPNELFFPLVVR